MVHHFIISFQFFKPNGENIREENHFPLSFHNPEIPAAPTLYAKAIMDEIEKQLREKMAVPSESWLHINWMCKL